MGFPETCSLSPFPLLKTASSSIAGLHFLSGFSLLQRNGLRTRVPIPNNRSSPPLSQCEACWRWISPHLLPPPSYVIPPAASDTLASEKLESCHPSLPYLSLISPPLPLSLHHMRSTRYMESDFAAFLGKRRFSQENRRGERLSFSLKRALLCPFPVCFWPAWGSPLFG